MDEDRSDELMNQAKGFFLKMVGVVGTKDPSKMAICFYDLVKQTYGLAKGEDVFIKEKEKIDDTLKGMMFLVRKILEQDGWTEEMIEEFDEKTMELWVID